jgi:hypothetical protein
MSEYDLVLHVGMPRSMDVLRSALARLRPQLHTHGVAVVGGAQIDRLRHASGWESGRGARRRDASAFESELAAAVAEERRHAAGVRGRPSVRTIVSSNRLLGAGRLGMLDAEQFRPYATRATAQVIRALSARRVQVVLYTHRQDRLMELSYLKRIRAGEQRSFEDTFPFCFEPVLDYLDLIDRLQAVPNVSEVVVRPLELVEAGQHAFVNDFLALLGLENALDLYAMGIDPWPYPSVYSARGAQLALALNPIMDTPAERRRVRTYVQKNYKASERYSTDLLDREVRQRILDCYADRNRKLFDRYLPELPADSYADDPSTFALGNVLGQPKPPTPPTVSDRLWTATSVTATEALVELQRRARPAAGRARRALIRRARRSR